MPKKNPISIIIGQNVRARRNELELSQEKLGFESSLDRTFIGHIERGSRNITIITLCKIARALKTQPQKLLNGIDTISI